jgi:hypothetical protein
VQSTNPSQWSDLPGLHSTGLEDLEQFSILLAQSAQRFPKPWRRVSASPAQVETCDAPETLYYNLLLFPMCSLALHQSRAKTLEMEVLNTFILFKAGRNPMGRKTQQKEGVYTLSYLVSPLAPRRECDLYLPRPPYDVIYAPRGLRSLQRRRRESRIYKGGIG